MTSSNQKHDHIVWELRCPECRLLYWRKNSEGPSEYTYRARVQNCPECSTEVIPFAESGEAP